MGRGEGSLAGLKVGYVPYAPGCAGPADRRRFCYWARARGLEFEPADVQRPYDLVVVSGAADFSLWRRRPRELGKMVLDLTDPYLSQELTLAERLKGPLKYVAGRWKHWEWSFSGALQALCRRVDGILCSTPEQASKLARFNPRVQATLDFDGGDLSMVKADWQAHRPFRLVWEGVGDSLLGFPPLAPVLRELGQEFPLELHLLTDLRFRRMNHLFPTESRRLLRRLLPGTPSYLYEWNKSMLSTIACHCDLAILPVDMSNPMVRDKAENRLMLFWRLGLPCATSATPAFQRVFRECGLRDGFQSAEDWRRGLARLMASQEERCRNVDAGRAYLAERVSEPQLLANWNHLIEAVMAS